MQRSYRLALILSLFTAATHAEEVPDDWAFAPVRRPNVPGSSDSRSPVDAFISFRLRAAGLSLSPSADRTTWLRRVTIDLTGLPPTPEDSAAFLIDDSAHAYENVVNRLLGSPAYGERQALPWLDLARFAESDGFKADDRRPNAWRYRDYVIQSFNADKPFDRFIREQLAGDELAPNDPASLIATGFLRHYPDEYNAVNLEQRRQEILNDITDTTSQAFLGLTVGCAKCHDHKFDPISQRDYYQLQAAFAGWKEADFPILPIGNRPAYEQKLHAWEDATASIRSQIVEIERPYQTKFTAKRRGRFPDEYARLLDIPPEKRTPLEGQIAFMVAKQVYAEEPGTFASMPPADKARRDALKKQFNDAGPRPEPPAVATGFTDVGRDVPPTHVLKRGSWSKKGEEVRPGFITVIDDRPANPTAVATTTGRRTALAHWIADAKNPLTARVLVNRVWQQHFGRGIVASSGDFGAQGDRPTHPELLDWLADEFVQGGWSVKYLHRLIVLSDVYRQSSTFNADAARIDPENKLLWRMNRRRLDGEALRDSILALAGVLNPKAGGPSVFPELPSEIKPPAGWPVSADAAERNRRSVYVFVKRNLRYPLFAAFDAADRNEACSRRFVTTTAPQALMLLNEKLIAEKARLFAERVRTAVGDRPDAVVERAFRIALGRGPTSEEQAAGSSFLSAQADKAGGPAAAAADFCHALLNLNEFVYVD